MNRFPLRLPALAAAAGMLLSLFAGCAGQQASSSQAASSSSPAADSAAAASVLFGRYADEDLDSDIPQDARAITLPDDLTVVEGDGVSVSGNTVTIGQAGTYLLSGELTAGQLVIDAGEKDSVRLILQNVSITNPDGAALYAKNCGKLILTLAPDSDNLLADSAGYLFEEGEDEPDAALFSKADLTINGTGALTVSANYRNGIASKDNLVITGGEITVTAVNDALRGKDSVSISGGTLDLTAGNDGIKSNQDNDPEKGWIGIDGGTFRIEAGCDAVQAETSLRVSGGDFTVLTGGGSVITDMSAAAGGFGPGAQPGREGGPGGRSDAPLADPAAASRPETPGAVVPSDAQQPPVPAQADASDTAAEEQAAEETADSFKGFKAGSELTICGGTFSLDCLDDALHSNGSLTIEAGSFTIATDDDGLHADGDAVINGGILTITRCYEGIEGASVTVNGGEIRLTARDDGINSAGGSDAAQPSDHFSQGGSDYHIVINGGYLAVTASGDGLDANGSITLNGGTVLINGPTVGADSALDYNVSCEVNGGILAAAGSAGMAQNLSDSSQQPVLTVRFDQNQAAGTAVNLTDEAGNLLLSFAPSHEFGLIQLSVPGLSLGERYTLSLNPDGNGGTDGYAESAEPGEALFTVVLESACTVVGSDGQAASLGMGGGGRGQGGMREPGAREDRARPEAPDPGAADPPVSSPPQGRSDILDGPFV